MRGINPLIAHGALFPDINHASLLQSLDVPLEILGTSEQLED